MSAPVKVRGGGYGLDAELAAKAAAKYDPALERAATKWIIDVLASSGDTITEPFPAASTFGASLKDGQVLCHLINAIKSGSIKKVETSKMPFKQMENISHFIKSCRALGVPEFELFETVDLYEEKDLSVVVNCILALARVVKTSVPTFHGPFPDIPHRRSNSGDTASPGGIVTPTEGSETIATPPLPLSPNDATTPLPPAPESTALPPPPLTSQHHDDQPSTSPKPTTGNPVTSPPPATTTITTPKSLSETWSPGVVKARGGGYGLDAELAAKAAAKYDVSLEAEVRGWVEEVVGQPFPSASFGESLQDGQILCHLINKIKPGSVKKVETSKMPFKQMENISNFLKACRAIGVPEPDLFETVDLYELKDLSLVVRCLDSLGRTAQKKVLTFEGPHLGAKLATQNVRNFSEDVLSRSCATLLSMGSSTTMERLPLNMSASVTFGAEKVGVGSNVPTKLHMGGTQERLPLDCSTSITFGAEKAGLGSSVASKQTTGDSGHQERLPLDLSHSITFGHDKATGGTH